LNAILRDRKNHKGEKYWRESKFGDPTFYEDEVEELKD
jgi:hypothetical protein